MLKFQCDSIFSFAGIDTQDILRVGRYMYIPLKIISSYNGTYKKQTASVVCLLYPRKQGGRKNLKFKCIHSILRVCVHVQWAKRIGNMQYFMKPYTEAEPNHNNQICVYHVTIDDGKF